MRESQSQSSGEKATICISKWSVVHDFGEEILILNARSALAYAPAVVLEANSEIRRGVELINSEGRRVPRSDLSEELYRSLDGLGLLTGEKRPGGSLSGERGQRASELVLEVEAENFGQKQENVLIRVLQDTGGERSLFSVPVTVRLVQGAATCSEVESILKGASGFRVVTGPDGPKNRGAGSLPRAAAASVAWQSCKTAISTPPCSASWSPGRSPTSS